MAKVLCVLYDDPVDGYPEMYARDAVPVISSYPGGQTAPTPKAIDFKPGQLLGSVSGGSACANFSRTPATSWSSPPTRTGRTGLRARASRRGMVISQPFWPAYLTAERIAKAKKLKLAITAGIGSDHVDLQAAIEHGDHRRRGHLLQQHQRR